MGGEKDTNSEQSFFKLFEVLERQFTHDNVKSNLHDSDQMWLEIWAEVSDYFTKPINWKIKCLE